MGGGFKNLQPIDGEIFAQDRQRHGCSGRLQIVQRALEKLLVGQHRKARRTALFVSPGDEGGMEVFLQESFAG